MKCKECLDPDFKKQKNPKEMTARKYLRTIMDMTSLGLSQEKGRLISPPRPFKIFYPGNFYHNMCLEDFFSCFFYTHLCPHSMNYITVLRLPG